MEGAGMDEGGMVGPFCILCQFFIFVVHSRSVIV